MQFSCTTKSCPAGSAGSSGLDKKDPPPAVYGSVVGQQVGRYATDDSTDLLEQVLDMIGCDQNEELVGQEEFMPADEGGEASGKRVYLEPREQVPPPPFMLPPAGPFDGGEILEAAPGAAVRTPEGGDGSLGFGFDEPAWKIFAELDDDGGGGGLGGEEDEFAGATSPDSTGSDVTTPRSSETCFDWRLDPDEAAAADGSPPPFAGSFVNIESLVDDCFAEELGRAGPKRAHCGVGGPGCQAKRAKVGAAEEEAPGAVVPYAHPASLSDRKDRPSAVPEDQPRRPSSQGLILLRSAPLERYCAAQDLLQHHNIDQVLAGLSRLLRRIDRTCSAAQDTAGGGGREHLLEEAAKRFGGLSQRSREAIVERIRQALAPQARCLTVL